MRTEKEIREEIAGLEESIDMLSLQIDHTIIEECQRMRDNIEILRWVLGESDNA